jgi:hypothetical protein
LQVTSVLALPESDYGASFFKKSGSDEMRFSLTSGEAAYFKVDEGMEEEDSLKKTMSRYSIA